MDGEEVPVCYCKYCFSNNGKESSTQHYLSPYETPRISPEISLSSSGSFDSSCSESSVDWNFPFQNREDVVEGILYSCQEDKYNVKNHSSSLSLHIPMEELDNSSSVIEENLDDNHGENTSNDAQHINTGDGLEGITNAIDNSSQSFTSTEEGAKCSLEIETDPRIWVPPEAKDEEDDIECSVADTDDDDEFSDGTKWGQPTSLSSFGGEHGRRYRFREERRKALVEVMNGRFRAFLDELLTEVGVAFSEEAGESWLDIVSSLSWEAATLIKPDATEGRAMDPTSYLKVKCIASGSRSQSQVIRGLVFKKNAAHKHMPTKYKNPRLLLLHGVLGQRVGGLLSFDSMEQEKDYLRSTIEMIEACHPNVVLVEKTVSRDIQEYLLSKGITLVYDMKLPRLERISRCTGSQLVSSANILLHPELKQCDSFHIAKFVEEHSSFGEGGKRPSKTLMYFEGCPKPLGSTILLKGAHNDELKKVKCVVQQAVFLAHHLILETSFLVDHSATFSNTENHGIVNGFLTEKQFPVVHGRNALTSDVSSLESLPDGIVSSLTVDIPISDGFQEMPVKEGRSHYSDLSSQGNSIGSSVSLPVVNSYENYFKQRSVLDDAFDSNSFQQRETSLELPEPVLPGLLCSSSSASLERDLGDNISLVTSSPYQMISSRFGFREKELDSCSIGTWSVSPLRKVDHKTEGNDKNDQEKLQDVICNVDKAESLGGCSELYSEPCHLGIPKEVQLPFKEDTKTESDPLGILVLQSSRCVLRGTAHRKQPHLSRIKYYGYSDMTLGRFLLDDLLNQKNQCSACGEPPEGHFYSYTHKNGKLMILVKRLPPEFPLPGEAEGKLWMWTRCFRCEQEQGLPKPTRRVVMSCATRGLSLGKFFELGFSNRLASSRLSGCGHMLHRDCLQFYGLGSSVAMFRYSSVDIYTACMPPPRLEFNNPNGQEWLNSEAKDVLEKGNLLFMEVMNSLQNMVSRFSHSKQTVNLMGLTKDLSDIEDMLKQEKSDFEALLQKSINKNGELGQTVHQILLLNCLKHELLLELYVWDRRLYALGLSAAVNRDTCNPTNEEQKLQDEISGGRVESRNALEGSDKVLEEPTHVPCLKNGPSLSHCDGHNTCNLSNAEMGLELKLENNSHSNGSVTSDVTVFQPLLTNVDHESRHSDNCISSVDSKDPLMMGSSIGEIVDVSSSDEHTTSATCIGLHESFREQELSTGPRDISSICNHLLLDQAIQTAEETRSAISIVDINQKAETINGSALDEIQGSVPSEPVPEDLLLSNLENYQDWVWTPFSETRKTYRKDLQRGFSQRFEFINNFTPAYLSTANQLMTQEMSRLHFPVDTDDNVVSVYEDEFSSIIACALALLQDQYSLTDNITEKDSRKDREREASAENLPGLVSDVAMALPHWFLEGSHSGQSFFTDVSSTSGSEGFFDTYSSLSSRALHPEIALGVEKLPGKSKYSVVCIHGKQFYSLRRHCCPSEVDYISSLSRCKKWDPQGGKSGVYFAKTLDDRFIVKQIKKTELDSFLKFASEYFHHISHSLSSGNQTCLAKILGIYQVIIRQSKSGKEVKIYLIVMENLFFGRNILRMYDLKGVLHRYASDENGTRKVLLDQNFVDDMILSPFYVSGKTKHLLERAIWNDTHFLTSINVMDYSLLLGVDKQHHEIVFGIIDYLRQYTWDKQLETWVKASLVVPKNEQPTVVSPKEYKKRFRSFMSTYFLAVPEHWRSEQFPGHCKSSHEGSDESSQSNNLELIEKSNGLS